VVSTQNSLAWSQTARIQLVSSDTHTNAMHREIGAVLAGECFSVSRKVVIVQ
jgi:hypothetical protein